MGVAELECRSPAGVTPVVPFASREIAQACLAAVPAESEAPSATGKVLRASLWLTVTGGQ